MRASYARTRTEGWDRSAVNSDRSGRCLLRWMDADRDDPVLADRFDPDRVAVGLDHVAALRKPAQLAEHVTADRVVRVGVDGEVDADVDEITEGHMSAHVPVPVRQSPHLARMRVGLVLDLPHDLFEDVLDGDDPDGAAVLVDHDRHVDL